MHEEQKLYTILSVVKSDAFGLGCLKFSLAVCLADEMPSNKKHITHTRQREQKMG